MALKKREKILSPEAIKENLKKELAPFWINSDVLFSTQLYPVSDKFTKQICIVFLLDIADYCSTQALDNLLAWQKKYDKLPWFPVIVFQQKYLFFKNRKFFDQFKNSIVFFDAFGELFARFGSNKEPVALILKNGEMVSSLPLLPNFGDQLKKIESELQKLLRLDDPGLPLPQINSQYKKMNESMSTVGIDKVSTLGEWNGSKTMLYAEENNVEVSFGFKGKKLRLVAMTNPDARETVRVSISFNDKPLPFPMRTELIREDSKGLALFEIDKTQGIYDIVFTETTMTGVIKLKFLNVFDNGVVFYEFRIAE
jgi:hypothetical protein